MTQIHEWPPEGGSVRRPGTYAKRGRPTPVTRTMRRILEDEPAVSNATDVDDDDDNDTTQAESKTGTA